MEKLFNTLAQKLLHNLHDDEHLKVSIDGEESQFIRFSRSKVRQSGLVDDSTLMITLIKNERTCSGSFTLKDNLEENEKLAFSELNRLRQEVSTFTQS